MNVHKFGIQKIQQIEAFISLMLFLYISTYWLFCIDLFIHIFYFIHLFTQFI